jgi:putative transposase
MKNSRYSEAQIVAVLKEAENGVPVSELCRTHGMSGRVSNVVEILWRRSPSIGIWT